MCLFTHLCAQKKQKNSAVKRRESNKLHSSPPRHSHKEPSPTFFCFSRSLQVDPLYVATPHPLAHGSPSAWDARRDPFHTTGAAAELTPTRFDIGQQLALADDFDEAARLRAKTGHEVSTLTPPSPRDVPPNPKSTIPAYHSCPPPTHPPTPHPPPFPRARLLTAAFPFLSPQFASSPPPPFLRAPGEIASRFCARTISSKIHIDTRPRLQGGSCMRAFPTMAKSEEIYFYYYYYFFFCMRAFPTMATSEETCAESCPRRLPNNDT